jgi:hypothetical protein
VPETHAVLEGCTLLGGYGYGSSLQPGAEYCLCFTQEGVRVNTSSGLGALFRRTYSETVAVEFSGPGKVRTGGGFFGGGFGLQGAAEGMIVASVLNALTTRTKIHTVIRYTAVDAEAFFFYSKATPGDLRIKLSEVLSKIRRPVQQEQGTGTSTVSELERLVTLHREGALTDEEFGALKKKLIFGSEA